MLVRCVAGSLKYGCFEPQGACIAVGRHSTASLAMLTNVPPPITWRSPANASYMTQSLYCRASAAPWHALQLKVASPPSTARPGWSLSPEPALADYTGHGRLVRTSICSRTGRVGVRCVAGSNTRRAQRRPSRMHAPTCRRRRFAHRCGRSDGACPRANVRVSQHHHAAASHGDASRSPEGAARVREVRMPHTTSKEHEEHTSRGCPLERTTW